MKDKNIKTQFGKRLLEIRKRYGLSQEKMVKLFPGYVEAYTLSRYEKGQSSVPVEFAIQFCKKFDLNPNWLFIGTGPQQVSRKGEPRKPEEIYFELIESLKDKSFDLDTSELNSKISETHPEYILDMLKKMSENFKTKSEVLRFFYMMVKDRDI
jgi:transcriptional regulator with XRE-family HTH domain